MQNRFMVMLVGGMIGAGIVSIVTGEMQWGLFIGTVIGIGVSEWLTKRKESKGEVETDERVETNQRKFMISTFFIANFLLLTYLIIAEFVLDKQFVEIRYLTYYFLAVFMISLFIGPVIVKRR